MRLSVYTRGKEVLYRRASLRFLLGMIQMITAGVAIILLVFSGVNRVSLLAATLASILTVISVLLFRK